MNDKTTDLERYVPKINDMVKNLTTRLSKAKSHRIVCITFSEALGSSLTGDSTYEDVLTRSYWEVLLAACDGLTIGPPITITEWMQGIKRGKRMAEEAAIKGD